MPAMHAALLAEAKPWTYWISFVLVGVVVLSIIGTAIGYIVKVTSLRYPKQR
jgi:hypothetical protein